MKKQYDDEDTVVDAIKMLANAVDRVAEALFLIANKSDVHVDMDLSVVESLEKIADAIASHEE